LLISFKSLPSASFLSLLYLLPSPLRFVLSFLSHLTYLLNSIAYRLPLLVRSQERLTQTREHKTAILPSCPFLQSVNDVEAVTVLICRTSGSRSQALLPASRRFLAWRRHALLNRRFIKCYTFLVA
jgi:hypothetical protein